MANERYKLNYSVNGSAAYAAVPQPEPARLPAEKPVRQERPKHRARPVIAPLAVIGLALTAVLLLMVVHSYVRLYETTQRAGELSTQLSEARAETAKLRSTYESRIDLAQIEERARELGMAQPTTRQTVVLNIAGADRGEVLQVDERGFAEKAWDAVTGGLQGMLEYFH